MFQDHKPHIEPSIRRHHIIANLPQTKHNGIKSVTLEWKSQPKDIKRPCGMTFIKSGQQLIVVDNDSKGAKVLDVENGGIIETIADQHTVYDVCTSHNERTVLFSNSVEERIEEYRVTKRNQTNFYDSWRRRKLTPRGITINEEFDLYLIVNRKEPAVHSYPCTKTSAPQQTPSMFGNDILQAPVFICTDKLNKYYVSDELLHQVIVFNSQGHVIGRLGQKGSGPGELLKPQGVAIDDWGNVIVADSLNDRLSVFSNDGRFLRHVQCNPSPLLRPVGLVINNNSVAISQQYMSWNSVALYTVDL